MRLSFGAAGVCLCGKQNAQKRGRNRQKVGPYAKRTKLESPRMKPSNMMESDTVVYALFLSHSANLTTKSPGIRLGSPSQGVLAPNR